MYRNKIPWIYLLALLTFIFFLPKVKNKLQYSEEFYGIAENQIRSYSRPNDVTVQNIRVRLGQSVLAGDTLMIFQPKSLFYKKEDLASQSRLIDIDRQSDQFQLRQQLDQALSKKVLIPEEYRIKTDRLWRQKKITDSLASLVLNAPVNNSRFDSEIKTLDEMKEIDIKNNENLIMALERAMSQSPDPSREKQSSIHAEVSRLEEQQKELVLLADTEGMIGQLEVQNGDPVPAYQSLIKIYSAHPNLVTAYINEGYLGKVTFKDSVLVQSISETGYQLKGSILNLGSRIAVVPDRLKKIPELKAWGREVQIEIPADNRLIQGEKVKVIFLPKENLN
ncbi:MAG: HlyD family secretion protein [Saprospiraceae bacterium]|nr:HlyD family secretion protein [Saprospiraceae bacterium]